MRDVCLAIEGYAMVACIAALLALLAVAAAFLVCRSGRTVMRKRHGHALSLLAVAAAVAAALKPPTAQVTWDEYFVGGTSEINTNDLRRIDFAWDVHPAVPSIATASLSAVPATNANEHIRIATVPMTNRALSVYMETAATNYLYYMYCSFIPDAPVVTNGVYHLNCLGGDNAWIPIGVSIYADEIVISPRRSYLEDFAPRKDPAP